MSQIGNSRRLLPARLIVRPIDINLIYLGRRASMGLSAVHVYSNVVTLLSK